MDIKILASGSSGNAYYLDGEMPLLLEAGIPFRAIQQKLNFKISQLAGCLVSHEHMDHIRAAKDLLRSGVDCYMTKGTADALALTGHRVHIIKALCQFRIGNWSVLPFGTIHDAVEPVGFLLSNRGAKLLYATDTKYIPYRFMGLTHILVECNYSAEIVKRLKATGDLDRKLWCRVIKSHMSLETLVGFLKANDLSQVKEIWLLHMSDNNSDAAMFKRRIQETTGKMVQVGRSGGIDG